MENKVIDRKCRMFEWKLNSASKSTEYLLFLCIYRNYWNNVAKLRKKKCAQIAFKIHFIAGVPNDYSRLHRNHSDRELHFMHNFHVCIFLFFVLFWSVFTQKIGKLAEKKNFYVALQKGTRIFLFFFYSNPLCVYVFFHSFIHYYEHISGFFFSRSLTLLCVIKIKRRKNSFNYRRNRLYDRAIRRHRKRKVNKKINEEKMNVRIYEK